MRVSVVLLWFCLSCVQLQRADDQLTVGDEQGEQLVVGDEQGEQLIVGDEQTEFTQSQIEELKKQNTVAEGSADSVEATGEENSIRRKVAFSYALGLNGNLGPHSTGVIVPFRRRITDVGRAYNTVTGVFTAPLRGVYYFRFNILGYSRSHRLAVCLYKNHQKILDVTEYPRGWYKYAVGGATLLLRRGDHVYVALRRNSQIHDNSNNHCTFTGFLLFPM
ncbi:collagen alpha-2(VIII) chain-like [Colossoma macropomum]|uniref:collagen alpha-2(VIII) chain-like n=1 Tax=Colossoma macropomum TaxID=42526 RepID=UPI001864B6C3|nr:collagen alpha-2(VIII) chain-like [Colossoma macropomum]